MCIATPFLYEGLEHPPILASEGFLEPVSDQILRDNSASCSKTLFPSSKSVFDKNKVIYLVNLV